MKGGAGVRINSFGSGGASVLELGKKKKKKVSINVCKIAISITRGC